jgi:hypothetical protein
MSCNGLGRTCLGFVFRKQSNSYFDLNGKDLSFLSYNHTSPKKRTVRILRYSKDGATLIKKHRCVNTVGRLLNIHPSAIKLVCEEKQMTAGGFHWKYDTNQIKEA